MVVLVIAVVAVIAVVLYVALGHKGTVKPPKPSTDTSRFQPPTTNNMSGFQQPQANRGNPAKAPVHVTPAPVKYVKGSPKQSKKAIKKYNGRSF